MILVAPDNGVNSFLRVFSLDYAVRLGTPTVERAVSNTA